MVPGGNVARYEQQLSNRRSSWTHALGKARCRKDGARVLETEMPEVVCSKCGARYTLAVRVGWIFTDYDLFEQPSLMEREVKETVIKEVVQIPCKYCGAFIPQTNLFCYYCGARRI